MNIAIHRSALCVALAASAFVVAARAELVPLPPQPADVPWPTSEWPTGPLPENVDRAALDGVTVDHAPVDVHVGSIAVRRFIESRQPRVTLHGHVHESARITGAWSDRIGRTILLGAAHDGPELALVRFDPRAPEGATRELL